MSKKNLYILGRKVGLNKNDIDTILKSAWTWQYYFYEKGESIPY